MLNAQRSFCRRKGYKQTSELIARASPTRAQRTCQHVTEKPVNIGRQDKAPQTVVGALRSHVRARQRPRRAPTRSSDAAHGIALRIGPSQVSSGSRRGNGINTSVASAG